MQNYEEVNPELKTVMKRIRCKPMMRFTKFIKINKKLTRKAPTMECKVTRSSYEVKKSIGTQRGHGSNTWGHKGDIRILKGDVKGTYIKKGDVKGTFSDFL